MASTGGTTVNMCVGTSAAPPVVDKCRGSAVSVPVADVGEY